MRPSYYTFRRKDYYSKSIRRVDVPRGIEYQRLKTEIRRI